MKTPSNATVSNVIKKEPVPNYPKEQCNYKNFTKNTPIVSQRKQEHIMQVVRNKCENSNEGKRISAVHEENKNVLEKQLLNPQESGNRTNIECANDSEYCDNRYYSDDAYSLCEDNIVYKIPYKIQENIEKILNDNPDGIWCGKLHEVYL